MIFALYIIILLVWFKLCAFIHIIFYVEFNQ